MTTLTPQQLAERLERAQTELDVLRRFSRAVHAPDEAHRMYRELYEQARRFMMIDAMFIALLEPDGRHMQAVFAMDDGTEYTYDRQWSFNPSGPTGFVAQQGQPVRFNDINLEMAVQFPQIEHAGSFGDEEHLSRSWLMVPMLLDTHVSGVICVQSYAAAVYGSREERLLVTLAGMLALALVQMRLLEQRRTMREALAAPLIGVANDVVIVPLIGRLTVQRLALVRQTLLTHVERQRVQQVILDVTGIGRIDEPALRELRRVLQALTLLGARCTISGVRSDVAYAMSQEYLDLPFVSIAQTVQQALGSRFNRG